MSWRGRLWWQRTGQSIPHGQITQGWAGFFHLALGHNEWIVFGLFLDRWRWALSPVQQSGGLGHHVGHMFQRLGGQNRHNTGGFGRALASAVEAAVGLPHRCRVLVLLMLLLLLLLLLLMVFSLRCGEATLFTQAEVRGLVVSFNVVVHVVLHSTRFATDGSSWHHFM